MDLPVGGTVVELEPEVVVADGPAETVGLVCFSGPECLDTGHSFDDVEWTVCGENGPHGEVGARLVESVYFG